jgi:hypothetical protein
MLVVNYITISVVIHAVERSESMSTLCLSTVMVVLFYSAVGAWCARGVSMCLECAY